MPRRVYATVLPLGVFKGNYRNRYDFKRVVQATKGSNIDEPWWRKYGDRFMPKLKKTDKGVSNLNNLENDSCKTSGPFSFQCYVKKMELLIDG